MCRSFHIRMFYFYNRTIILDINCCTILFTLAIKSVCASSEVALGAFLLAVGVCTGPSRRASWNRNYFTTDGQSVNMSWYRAPLWDLRLDIISCRNVAVWNLRSCIYWAPSLTMKSLPRISLDVLRWTQYRTPVGLLENAVLCCALFTKPYHSNDGAVVLRVCVAMGMLLHSNEHLQISSIADRLSMFATCGRNPWEAPTNVSLFVNLAWPSLTQYKQYLIANTPPPKKNTSVFSR
jgi:hypothetical protein